MYSLTCVLGVVNHYIVPQIRKEMPWLLFSEPIVKQKEWDAYEVSGTMSNVIRTCTQRPMACTACIIVVCLCGDHYRTASSFDDHYHMLCVVSTEMPKVSYVEHMLQWLLFTEKYILYPLTFLFAFNLSAHHYRARFTDM